jgi:CubicO group peptidase (beta-lactamase class C family)
MALPSPGWVIPMGEDVIPATVAEIEAGMASGLHVGAQLAVAVDGVPVAEVATGLARPGVAMTSETLMLWLSATKVVTAVAVAQQWERGELDLDERVADHIPEFGVHGKDVITIRHLLTHTAGIRGAGGTGDAGMRGGWDAVIARICAARLEPGWVPGHRAGYHPSSAHMILGELVRLISGRPFGQYVREEILEPLGARDWWIGVPTDRYAGYGDRIGLMYDTANGRREPVAAWSTAESAAGDWPSRNGRGPARDLVRVLDVLRGRGESGGVRLLQPQTVDAMASHQRVGMFDRTFGAVMDWGLGFVLDSKYALGDQVQPYGYGAHSSPRTFGHSGSQSSVAFVDPEFGLSVALVCNGMCGEQVNTERQHRILTALYDDLGFAWT